MGDAFFDEPFCRALVQAIGRGETCATGSGQLRFRPTASFATLCGPDPARGPVGRPLSHGATTVVTMGERLLLRAYHRLRPGINPELELSCYLSEVARFPHCVPVAGTLDHVASDGTVLSLALLQAYVPNQGNGWAYTQAYLERHLEAWRSNPAGAPADVHGGYLALMQTLGTRTAELHQALGRPASNPALGAEPPAPGGPRAGRGGGGARGSGRCPCGASARPCWHRCSARPRRWAQAPHSRPACMAITASAGCCSRAMISSSSASAATAPSASIQRPPRARRFATWRA